MIDPHSILRNAEEHRTGIQDSVAHHRLVASARAAHPATGRRRPGVRLGLALARIGTRLQGVQPAPVPDPDAILAKSR